MNKFAMKENGFEYVDLGLPSGTIGFKEYRVCKTYNS